MTEESIDTERMMLGIDDAGNHSINWIRCSNRMPPDDKDYKCILKNEDQPIQVANGYQIDLLNCMGLLQPNSEWITYDEQTWKELNEK